MLTSSLLGIRALQWVKIEGMLCKPLLSNSEGRLPRRPRDQPATSDGRRGSRPSGKNRGNATDFGDRRSSNDLVHR